MPGLKHLRFTVVQYNLKELFSSFKSYLTFRSINNLLSSGRIAMQRGGGGGRRRGGSHADHSLDTTVNSSSNYDIY